MGSRVIHRSSCHWRLGMYSCLILLAISTAASAQQSVNSATESRSLGAIDIGRIRELYHITDTFGADIWPGFDTRKIPVAINNDDREELLVGHPAAPKEYHPFEDHELNGQPALIREGVDRFGPRGGGWAVEIGGKRSAYVSTLEEGRDTEGYLSLILHECFHCFQKGYRQRAEGAHGDLPEDDPVYSALIGLESRILKSALDQQHDAEVREHAQLFVAVRHERRKQMPKHLIILEGEQEYSEGTATYSQARLYQLLVERGGIKPLGRDDPQYHGFPNAQREFSQMIQSIVPPPGRPITFFHAMYQIGMAQCLVLDRVRPEWKDEMREKGMTQFALFEMEFPLDTATEQTLLATAEKRFDYDSLLAEQKKLIDERLALIRGYIDGPGRLYRIYHGQIRKRFKWKPVGPVYHVPESLESELSAKRKSPEKSLIGKLRQAIRVHVQPAHRRTVWAGGIRRFEKEGLLLESSDTPIVFGHEYIEWIDTDPAKDNSDMKVESKSEEDGVYVGVQIKTDGFTLTAEKAQIEWSQDVVEIYPLSE